MTDIKRIIEGKAGISHIVAIEPNDAEATIFTEKDGIVDSFLVKNRYWVLASMPMPGGAELKGNLHYKYGKQFSSREDFEKFRIYNRTKDIYSVYDAKEALMIKDGFRYHQGMRHNDVSVLSFDIESMGLYHDKDSFIFIISNTFRSNGKTIRKMFTYDEFNSQAEMLQAWCEWVRETNPSIICGHNIFGYDLPYMQHVAELNETTLELGRDGSEIKFDKYTSEKRKDQVQSITYRRCHIYGRNIVDTMFLAIDYDIASKKYESYGLKQIIKQEGLEVKGRVFYDAGLIKNHYTNPVEWEKIKAYAMFDADDSLALFDLMSPARFYMTQMVPKSFSSVCWSASGSMLNSILVGSYLQEGHSIPKADDVVEFVGAISHGISGIHNNVLSFDVASLYPSVMLSFNIYSKDKDPNAHLIKLLDTLTNERLKNKQIAKETGDRYYDDLQSSQKILSNSIYGFMGARGLNFNYTKGAAEVTKKGRDILMSAIKWATGKEYLEWKKENGLLEETLEEIQIA